jgi:hypothetical protein
VGVRVPRLSGSVVGLFGAVCGLGGALAGCNEFLIDPTDDTAPPPEVVVSEVFIQQPAFAIDLLWVVDDTASMAQEQLALTEVIPTLTTALEEAGVRWQAGVTTTTVGHAEAGWLIGDPYVLASGSGDVLATRVAAGTSGVGPEAGFSAAAAAIALAGDDGPNRGWRRPEAELWVVFLSDADDRSDAFPEVSDFIAALPMGAHVAAIVGDSPYGCVTSRGAARPGLRYLAAVDATGGVSQSICEPDFSALADAVAAAVTDGRSLFSLRAEPVPGSVQVRVDGSRTEAYSVRGSMLSFDRPPSVGSEVRVTYLAVVEGS